MFSIETLQFKQLLTLISRYAQTPLGESRVLDFEPHRERLKLDRDLRILAETIDLASDDAIWSFYDLEEPREAIDLLRIENAALEPLVLRDVAKLLSQALEAKRMLREERETAPTLWQIVESLPKELSKTADKIVKKILPGGELDDAASPELRRLRREINAQRGRLTKSLEAFMREKGDAIQDAIVTVRNGRFVVPVKSNFAGKVNGVTHDASSSGATVFIEPLDSIEANNEIQTLKAKEESEIARILFSLTKELRESLPFIERAIEIVSELDAIKAKLVFAQKFDALVPDISNDETLELIDARHPLLEKSLDASSMESGKRKMENSSGVKQAETRPPGSVQSVPPASSGAKASGGNPTVVEGVSSPNVSAGLSSESTTEIVPISFSLTEKNSVMIISGANAGGKTVVLKTAGLLSLMAISGLPVPAKQARVPFYKSVLADIGDHQSISANLSTFSSHVSNIAAMMKDLSTPALVLLDEVGTGTDPEEGSALGVAVVDHFRKNDAQVIASTHYKGLKIYAANDEDVINASVEFDEKTLEPTYRLLTGIAGASSGLEIARRFGIREDVIENARENLDVSAQKAENYLHKLQKETKQAEDLRTALEEEREATAEKYAKLDVEFHKKERKRRKEFEVELDSAIRDFERQSKEFLKSLKDKKERKKFEKQIASQRAKLVREKEKLKGQNESGATVREAVATRSTESAPEVVSVSDAPIELGSRVLLKSFGTNGTVEKIDGETAEVLVGSMRIKQKLSELQLIKIESSSDKNRLENLQKQAKQSDVDLEVSDVQSELNLIGKTTLDAEIEVDRFLDQSYVSKLAKVRIIHGFGTGALKNSVHQMLKGHPHVEGFGFAPQNEGGNGATIVELKQ